MDFSKRAVLLRKLDVTEAVIEELCIDSIRPNHALYDSIDRVSYYINEWEELREELLKESEEL